MNSPSSSSLQHDVIDLTENDVEEGADTSLACRQPCLDAPSKNHTSPWKHLRKGAGRRQQRKGRTASTTPIRNRNRKRLSTIISQQDIEQEDKNEDGQFWEQHKRRRRRRGGGGATLDEKKIVQQKQNRRKNGTEKETSSSIPENLRIKSTPPNTNNRSNGRVQRRSSKISIDSLHSLPVPPSTLAHDGLEDSHRRHCHNLPTSTTLTDMTTDAILGMRSKTTTTRQQQKQQQKQESSDEENEWEDKWEKKLSTRHRRRRQHRPHSPAIADLATNNIQRTRSKAAIARQQQQKQESSGDEEKDYEEEETEEEKKCEGKRPIHRRRRDGQHLSNSPTADLTTATTRSARSNVTTTRQKQEQKQKHMSSDEEDEEENEWEEQLMEKQIQKVDEEIRPKQQNRKKKKQTNTTKIKLKSKRHIDIYPEQEEDPSSLAAIELYQFQEDWEKGVQSKSTQPTYKSEYWKIWKRTTQRTLSKGAIISNKNKKKKSSKKKNRKKKIISMEVNENDDNNTLELDTTYSTSQLSSSCNNGIINVNNFSAVHKIALSKLMAGMHRNAFQFCHDVIWNWTQQAHEQQGHLYRCHPHFTASTTSTNINLSSSPSMAVLSNIAKLRTGIAGMWCVYTHLLIEYILMIQKSQQQRQQKEEKKQKADTKNMVAGSTDRYTAIKAILPFHSRASSLPTNDDDESPKKTRNRGFKGSNTDDGGGGNENDNDSESTTIRRLLEYTDWILERVVYCQLVGNHPWVSLIRSRMVVLRLILSVSDKFGVEGGDKFLRNEIDELQFDLTQPQQQCNDGDENQTNGTEDMRTALQDAISQAIDICENGVHNCRTKSSTLSSRSFYNNKDGEQDDISSTLQLHEGQQQQGEQDNWREKKIMLFAIALSRPLSQLGQSTSVVMDDRIPSQSLKESTLSIMSLLPETPQIYMFLDEPQHQSLLKAKLLLCDEMNRLTRIRQQLKDFTSITVIRGNDDTQNMQYDEKEEVGGGLQTLFHFGVLHLKPLNQDISMMDSIVANGDTLEDTNKKYKDDAIHDDDNSSSRNETRECNIQHLGKTDDNAGKTSSCIRGINNASGEKKNREPGSACFAVEYICRKCTTAIFPSAKECQRHEQACKQQITKLPSHELDKLPPKPQSFSGAGRHLFNLNSSFTGSFNPERKVGLETNDLLNLLDYAVEFFVVGKTELNQVKPLRTNKASVVAAGGNETTDLHTSQNIPYFAGQVGLRCLFCRTGEVGLEFDHHHDYTCTEIFPAAAATAVSKPLFGERGSFRFPKTRRFLHKDVWVLCLTHMDTCANMPLTVKRRYMDFRDTVRMDSPVFEDYWHDAGSFLSSKRDGNGIFWQRLIPAKYSD